MIGPWAVDDSIDMLTSAPGAVAIMVVVSLALGLWFRS